MMRLSRHASASAPLVAVLATVALSVGLFFLFTLPGIKRDKGVTPEPESPEIVITEENDPVGTGPGPGTGVPPVPLTLPPAEEFRRTPGALVGELGKRLASGELDAVHELLSGVDGAEPETLAAAFGPEAYGPAIGHAPAEIGTFEGMNRWVLPLSPRQQATVPATGAADPERLFFDLAQAPTDPSALQAERPWEIRRVVFPPALRERIAAAGLTAPPPAGVGAGQQDAMVLADAFITAVNERDFIAALGSCGPEVPDEKIAGLCIVFEEGDFKLRGDRPLVATAIGGETAWVIAHVVSEKLDAVTEFGLEMKRAPADGGWKIAGINFGKMLDTYVAASEAGKVPYAPIKTRPGSGELLVLYFEYDRAELLPRAKRQLDILAGILKADPGKSLTIAGHADALGSENYNARLSAARAHAVKNQLVEFGVPEPQIDTTGFGEAKPWKPNLRDDGSDDPKGRSYNRRAEIYLDFEN